MITLINNTGDLNFPVNAKQILRLMRENGMLSQIRNTNPYKNSEMPSWDGTHKSFENLLDRKFDNPLSFNSLYADIIYL